ncbi:MAG TPA: sigma-54 dependent transcriptional regulator [Polyangiales bacterium]|nr:sigma-54 dependent transcriptional regulator [Polyangiales bacterium]
MDILEVYRRGELLGRYEMGARSLELGTAPTCDVVLSDGAFAAHHWLVARRRGEPLLFDISRGGRSLRLGQPLALDAELALGAEHVLKRVLAPDGASPWHEREGATQDLPRALALEGRLVLSLGSGREARRVRLDQRLLQIGRDRDCDVVLYDPAVSQRHAQLEPLDGAIWVRDLGSRNGTYVDGVPVQRAVLRHGSTLRLGRSDLRVLAPARTVAEGSGPQLVAESSSMLQVLADVQRMAALPWPVLVVGESGTGKEGVALSLHTHGPRRERPFVAVNAGGMPRELIESELFGHERGAFTGASTGHRGVFEQAHGGTLFLDEIAELPLDLQARLLRVLESGEIRRVGGERSLAVDVRLVCATHRDLRAMVADGLFRRDLYYRIARLVLQLPALRARPEDVGALAQHFLLQICDELGPRELSTEALRRLQAHDWPGNARELRNVLCAAAASSGGCIDVIDVERALLRLGDGLPSRVPPNETCRLTVARYGGNKTAAARALGIPRSTLRDRLRDGEGG